MIIVPGRAERYAASTILLACCVLSGCSALSDLGFTLVPPIEDELDGGLEPVDSGVDAGVDPPELQLDCTQDGDCAYTLPSCWRVAPCFSSYPSTIVKVADAVATVKASLTL